MRPSCEVSISYGMGYGRDPPAQLVNVPGGRLGHLPRRSYRFRRLKHLGSVGLLVDGANLVPQSPRRGVRGTIYNVLTFNLQGPIMGRNTSRRTKEPIASYTSGLQVTLNSISGPLREPVNDQASKPRTEAHFRVQAMNAPISEAQSQNTPVAHQTSSWIHHERGDIHYATEHLYPAVGRRNTQAVQSAHGISRREN